MTEANKNAVSAIARIAVLLRVLLLWKLRFESSFTAARVSFSNSIISPSSFLDFSIFNTDNAVCKLGDSVIMRNHYYRLMEFHAGNFQEGKNVLTRPAVQIASRFVGQNDLRLSKQSTGKETRCC